MIVDNCLRPGQQIAVLANAIAVVIAKKLTPTEENVIGNLIAQIGATLLAIAAIDQACESTDTASSTTSSTTDSTTDAS